MSIASSEHKSFRKLYKRDDGSNEPVFSLQSEISEDHVAIQIEMIDKDFCHENQETVAQAMSEFVAYFNEQMKAEGYPFSII